MSRLLARRGAARAALALLALALCWQPADAAPAPLARAPRPRTLCRGDLVGTWTMVWSGQRCTVTLSGDGNYTCQWFGLTLRGSWNFDREGRFWITESTSPADPRSWHSYAVKLDPSTLSGRVEQGAQRLEVRLVRQR